MTNLSYGPDVADNHLRSILQAFQVLLEPNHHGRGLVRRPLAESESQKAADGLAADGAPPGHAVQAIRFPLTVHAQSDPMEGLNIVRLNVNNARATCPEVIEKDAHMEAVVENRFVVEGAANEMLLVLVEFEILTRRRGPLPLNKAQESVNPC